ncbi:MAG: hypothetical protein ABI091_05705 [Ferruginibacter sp.]
MSKSIEDIIKAIKENPFTPKDYTKDISITLDGITILFHDEKKINIIKSLAGSPNEIKVDTLTGQVEISKNLFI